MLLVNQQLEQQPEPLALEEALNQMKQRDTESQALENQEFLEETLTQICATLEDHFVKKGLSLLKASISLDPDTRIPLSIERIDKNGTIVEKAEIISPWIKNVTEGGFSFDKSKLYYGGLLIEGESSQVASTGQFLYPKTDLISFLNGVGFIYREYGNMKQFQSIHAIIMSEAFSTV